MQVSDRLVTFAFENGQAQRLDKFLVSCLPDLSRTRIQNLIKYGMVTINGKLPRKTGQMLEERVVIQVTIPPVEPSDLVPEDIPLDIIFENHDLLVVNKPAGMVVHPSAGHTSGTLVHATLTYTAEIEGVGGVQRPGVVHRLDKNTSGLILLAKHDLSHRWLQDQFRKRKVVKTYLTLVDGHPTTPRGRIEAPIGRDLKDRKKMAVVPLSKGRAAISEYHTLESFHSHSFLEINPLTGRTHQIRLHLAFLGCPVTGDTVYGRRQPSLPIKRHFLHASRLCICLPYKSQPHTFEAPLPLELVGILDELRKTI